MQRRTLKLTAISMLGIAPCAWGQAQQAAVDSVQIDVMPMASGVVRAASVDWGVDLDHDQFITREEIDLAMTQASEHFRRAARASGVGYSGGGSRRGMRSDPGFGAIQREGNFEFASNSQFAYSVMMSVTSMMDERRFGTNSIRSKRAADRLVEVGAAYREFESTQAEEMSLVNADFRVRFSDLDGKQRTMLLKADTRGNNDGSLSAVEYVEFNDPGLFSRRGRFEREFGEDVHNVVFDTLLAGVDELSLDELEIVD